MHKLSIVLATLLVAALVSADGAPARSPITTRQAAEQVCSNLSVSAARHSPLPSGSAEHRRASVSSGKTPAP